jgi:hypothetical protein
MAMHETVHQGASQQKQVGQNTKQMRAVLRQQIEQGNRGKHPPHPLAAPEMVGMTISSSLGWLTRIDHHGLLPCKTRISAASVDGYSMPWCRRGPHFPVRCARKTATGCAGRYAGPATSTSIPHNGSRLLDTGRGGIADHLFGPSMRSN